MGIVLTSSPSLTIPTHGTYTPLGSVVIAPAVCVIDPRIGYLRILSGRFKVVLTRLVCLFDLVPMPHWPEKCAFGEDLDFCRVFAG